MSHHNSEIDLIAITGMSCQFPGAKDILTFWDNIKSNTKSTGLPPENRYDLKIHEEKFNLQIKGGYIDDYNVFDAKKFHIPQHDADQMDPQQQLVLTNVCRAIENAGIKSEDIRGDRTGVFVGAMANDMAYLKFSDVKNSTVPSVTGNGLCMIANRVSYELDFGGPSMTIDSACSSALVALHQAINAIRNDECDNALVAGVNIILSGLLQKFYADAGVGSDDGECRSFSSTASGIGRSEGVGVVLLQKLSFDSDKSKFKSSTVPRQIYAVINSSSVNNGGQSSRFTAPNKLSQIALLRRAYRDARISAEDIIYVEGHGTGTRQGDHIEINALKEVFKARSTPCLLGTVKSLIGHTEAASGIAGLIKVALMLYHNYIPQSLYFDTPSDNIDSDSPVQLVCDGRKIWNDIFKTGYMGVSSFGLGGTNAHTVLSNIAGHDYAKD